MCDQQDLWPVEEIPDGARLFRRVHRNFLRGTAEPDEDYIPPGAIKKEDSLSTDWSKYSTPEQTRSRAPSPEANGVISLPVGSVRRETSQTVEHDPEADNRSHSLVIGRKDEEIRMQLLRLARWEIRPAYKDEGGHRDR
jgi:hypothetical protein